MKRKCGWTETCRRCSKITGAIIPKLLVHPRSSWQTRFCPSSWSSSRSSSGTLVWRTKRSLSSSNSSLFSCWTRPSCCSCWTCRGWAGTTRTSRHSGISYQLAGLSEFTVCVYVQCILIVFCLLRFLSPFVFLFPSWTLRVRLVLAYLFFRESTTCYNN